MKKKQSSILILAIIALITVNFVITEKTSTSLIGLDEIDALACGEAGCKRDYSEVQIRELDNGKLLLWCTGCGSIKCEKPE